MLTIYRRHLKTCGQKSRRYRRCSCPVWVAGTLGGEKIEKSLDLTSIEAAEKVVHAWKEAGRIGAEGKKRESVNDATAKFIADCKARNLRAGTIQLYEQTLLSSFAPWCEIHRLTTVNQVDVEKLREYRESWKVKPVTAAGRIDRLRTFFSFCMDSGWMERNPAKAIKAPVVKLAGKEPFTEEELQAIYSACDRLVTHGSYGRENRARVKAFIYILRYTGLRISDASKLDESRVKDGRVFLRTEKTGTFVWVPIPQFVVDSLAEVPRASGFYFQTGNAKPKTVRGGWDRTLRTILELAGVKHGSAHAFRSTLAVDLLNKGKPVEIVAAVLGNSPAIVMRHYAPYVKSRQDALEEAVGSVWEEPKPKLKMIQGGG
jgi:integrase